MAPQTVTAFVALGSNLGDRRAHLAHALEALGRAPGVSVAEVSPVYETAPVGPPPQGPYLNAAVRVETSLAAPELLSLLHAIERQAGRVRGAERGMARSLDLDLLLYGDACIRTPDLQVPHPRLHERAFVLEPLRAIAADVIHPVLGERIDALARRARQALGAGFHAAVRSAREESAQEESMAIVAVSISPVGEGASVSRHVAAAVGVLRDQDRVRWRLDPMFTTLEGEVGEIFELIRRMQEAVFAAGALRVGTVIKMDERRDRSVQMEEKVRTVMQQIGRSGSD